MNKICLFGLTRTNFEEDSEIFKLKKRNRFEDQ